MPFRLWLQSNQGQKQADERQTDAGQETRVKKSRSCSKSVLLHLEWWLGDQLQLEFHATFEADAANQKA